MKLTEKELKVLEDKDFLISKHLVIEKILTQFQDVRRKLKTTLCNSNFIFDPHIDIENGKIFKGDNYRMLPYVVLDYPKFYSKGDVFTFRTMLWWGHFYSSTLHIEGKSLRKYRNNYGKSSSIS